MSPSSLSELLAVDRSSTATIFAKERQSRSHARRIYCAAYETSQGDRFDSFSAIADLLIIGGEDFSDLFRSVAVRTRLFRPSSLLVRGVVCVISCPTDKKPGYS